MTRTWVAIAGGLGLVVPLWTLGWYTSGDGFARALIALIVAGLVTGTAELWRRGARIDGLLEELPRLDGDAAGLGKRLEGSSELFARLVKSRMRGEPAPLPGITLTPYLVSLLVLLGLLGTFVGLVETLAGAREALSSSGDVTTLRAALLLPMKGLSRAFGTSVAGVSASALLGLGLTLCRRFEDRIYTVLDERFAGALSEATLVGRQIHALERIADQSDDLPNAVRELAEVARRLPSLEEALASRHDEVLKATRGAVEQAAREVSSSLTRGVERAVKAQDEVLSRIADGAASLLQERAQVFASRLDADAAARAEAEAARAADAARAEAARTASLEKELTRLFALEEERQARLEGLEARRTASLEEQLSRLFALAEAQAQALAEAEASRAASLEEKLAALTEREASRAVALEEQRALQLSREAERALALEQALSRAEALAKAAAEGAKAGADRLLAFEEQAQEARAAAATALHAEVSRWLEAAAAQSREERQGLASLSEAFAQGSERREAEAAARTAHLAERLEALAAAERQGHEELLAKTAGLLEGTEARAAERLAAAAEQVAALADAQLERERVLEAALIEGRSAAADALAARLAAYADKLEGALDKSTGIVREGADALAAGGLEVAALAERFADAIFGFKADHEAWLARLEALETRRAGGGAGEGDAEVGAYLEEAREVFERSVELQRELQLRLRALAPGELSADALPGGEDDVPAPPVEAALPVEAAPQEDPVDRATVAASAEAAVSSAEEEPSRGKARGAKRKGPAPKTDAGPLAP